MAVPRECASLTIFAFLTLLLALIISGCTFYELREHPKTDLAKQAEKKLVLHYRNIQMDLDHVQMTRTDVSGNVANAFRTDEEPDRQIHDREQALEAHVFLDSLNCDTIKNGMALRIPFDHIGSLKLYDVNAKRMVATYTIICEPPPPLRLE